MQDEGLLRFIRALLLITVCLAQTAHALPARQLQFKVGQREFALLEPEEGSLERDQFESLPLSERIAFHRKRRALLKNSARALEKIKLGFGAGAVLKDKISFAVRNLRIRNTSEDTEEKARNTLREHSEEMVQILLELIDKTIWTDAPLFAHSNEFGVVGAVGGQFIRKTFETQSGGLIDVGFTLAYNREENALAFQIFFEKEVLSSSVLPALVLAGANLKAGVYIAHFEPGQMQQEGKAIYAPPGAPTFMTHSPRDAMAGFSSGGPFTFPPSPIGDLVTNINRVERTYLYRGTISPQTRGFVRIYPGHVPQSVKWIVEPVRKAVDRLLKRDCSTQLTSNDDPL